MIEGVDYPKPWPLFWASAGLAVGYLVVALALRWRGWARGMSLPAAPRHPRGRVAGIWLVEVFAQPQLLLLSRLRWAAHLGVFWGFLGLCLLSAFHVGLRLLEFLTPDGGTAAWFLRGDGRAALKAWGNIFGLVLLAGLLLGLARRVFPRAAPAAASPESDLPLVLFLLWLTLSGFLLEGLRLAAGASPAAALRPWLTALWTIHGLGGLAFVAWVPHSTLLHALLSPLVIALNARAEHARKDLSWQGKEQRAALGSPKG
jgi:nitrate reductase gamma subunit